MNRRALKGFTAIAGLLAALLPAGASYGKTIDPGVEEAIRGAVPGVELPVIISLADKVDASRFKGLRGRAERKALRASLIKALRDKADSTQRPFLSLLRMRGAKAIRPLWINNSVAVSVRPEVVNELSAMPGVESIKLDTVLAAPMPSAGAPGAPQWNLFAVNAPALWGMGYDGAGTVVASMDTGVDVNHPDLSSSWRAGANSWFDPNGEHATPYDANGHGTQTMGVIAGGSAGGTPIGVAPGAKWISVKIYNDAGFASLSAIHQGFQWLLDPDNDPLTDDAPEVVSNSWGLSGNMDQCVTEFQQDVRALNASGIAVAFAAGNHGPNPYTSISPANYPESFSTGSVDEALALADFSSRGPSACDGSVSPEVSAPGVNVRTADLTMGGVFPNSYANVSGTSISVSHLSGAIALLSGAVPNATVNELELALKQSANDIGADGPDNGYGYGVIDAARGYDILRAMVSSDRDGDGVDYVNDCNDNDPSVYPGAVEVKHDAIDQDCNGYDLTIDILNAFYMPRRASLYVEATSALNKGAALKLGYLPMYWDAARSRWVINVKNVKTRPVTIKVSGPEGAETAKVQ